MAIVSDIFQLQPMKKCSWNKIISFFYFTFLWFWNPPQSGKSQLPPRLFHSSPLLQGDELWRLRGDKKSRSNWTRWSAPSSPHMSLVAAHKRAQTPDMEFVQKFTPPDFKVKNLTPSMSPYFNSFSENENENGEIYSAGKNLHCRRHWRHGQIPPLVKG